ncbi:hypothetical protein COW81_02580 [Candidatus Campbellbacteria bacterium CG22_combo_CG10-13_8_21_14_all_36_13]|uniref:Quinate/shikimate 5-dehydrogenase/glutamyl-tRNA reductase domain-containing protein n=1 Tax=Candidatus Campbellbacteria bacterium CG22_combo_CG10-13_8_21_14_all_36_13 TaxID=1974529 RepID=A0A2H0DXW0_9BACT|nr:MAG: hypothetical protein COW81_02580 [Candidatus Campbellbacteria bacterium CG22_combo_CG10-13_8_21_14_all_36_13]
MGALFSIIKSIFIMITPTWLARILFKQKGLVWIVHPRDTRDIVRKIGSLKNLSDEKIFKIAQRIPPFLVSNFHNDKISGYMIGIPVSPKILGSKEDTHVKFSVKKTRQALKMAYKLGATSVSLGGFLTSVVSKNNLEKEFNMKFYDGTRLLSRLAVDKIDRILVSNNFDITNTTIGILGATTKTGSLVSELLVQMNFNKIYLFGKTSENLEALKERCFNINPKIEVVVSTDLSKLSNCDINILTAYIQTDEEVEQYIKKDSIFLGAVEPASPFVFKLDKDRPDVTVYKGITVNTPDVFYDGYDLGLPKGNSFVCVTEAFLFTQEQESAEGVYQENLENTQKKVKALFEKYNFTSS